MHSSKVLVFRSTYASYLLCFCFFDRVGARDQHRPSPHTEYYKIYIYVRCCIHDTISFWIVSTNGFGSHNKPCNAGYSFIVLSVVVGVSS